MTVPRSVLLLAAFLAAGCLAAPPAARAPTLACASPCASAIDLGSADAPREVSLAVDPGDAQHFVVVAAMVARQQETLRTVTGQDAAVGDLIAAATFDGGRSWKATPLPFPTPRGFGDDAPVAFLPDGSVLVVGLGVSDASAGGIARSIYAWRSTDGGRSWSAPAVVEAGRGATAGGATAHDNDGPEIATRGNDVLLTWGRYDMDPAAAAGFTATFTARVSHDGGRSWGPAATLGGGPQVNDGWPAILPDGTLVATWNDDAQTVATPPAIKVLVAASRDGGATWKAEPVAEGTTSIWPRLATAGSEAVLCTTNATASEGDAWVTRASGDGLAWGAPRVVATHGHAMRPAPMCAGGPDGALWLAGYDDATAFRVLAGNASLVVDAGPTGVGDHALFGEYTGLAPFPHGAGLAWMGGSGDATKLLFARVTTTGS